MVVDLFLAKLGDLLELHLFLIESRPTFSTSTDTSGIARYNT